MKYVNDFNGFINESVKITTGAEEIYDLNNETPQQFVREYENTKVVIFFTKNNEAIITSGMSNMVYHGRDGGKTMKTDNVKFVYIAEDNAFYKVDDYKKMLKAGYSGKQVNVKPISITENNADFDYSENNFYSESDLHESDSIAKIQKQWVKITSDMKSTVTAWKSAEGKDKDKLLAKLKQLTNQKNSIELDLERAVELQDVHTEYVGENYNDIIIMRLRAERDKLNKQKSLPKVKQLSSSEINKIENQLIDLEQELKELYTDRRSLLSDMESEAAQLTVDEFTRQGLHNEYAEKLNNNLDDIIKLKNKIQTLETKLI